VLRKLPQEGESFEEQGWRFEVVDMDGRKIDKLLVSEAPSVLSLAARERISSWNQRLPEAFLGSRRLVRGCVAPAGIAEFEPNFEMLPGRFLVAPEARRAAAQRPLP